MSDTPRGDYAVVHWRCPRCQFYAVFQKDKERHVCPAAWEVADQYNVGDIPVWEDTRVVYAVDAAEAAEKWATWSDENSDYEYPIASGKTVPKVWVRPQYADDADGYTELTIEGRMEAAYYTYSQKEVKPVAVMVEAEENDEDPKDTEDERPL